MANISYRPHYQNINDILFPGMFSPDCIEQAMSYNPKKGDVFIVTYPKCGTTWMQNIALYIFRKGKELEDHRHFFMHCPFIDALGNQGIDLMPRPGAFKTHLPYNRMPYSPDAKYIYIMRNPKDCCTSLFYHAKMHIGFGYWDAKFDDFFELFMAGEVEYNDYFDHLMSFYPHLNDSQLFFTTYEDMKKDTKDVVLNLAKFLGKEYIDAIEKDNNILSNILNFSSFDYLKKNISDLFDSSRVSDKELDDPNMLEGSRHMEKYAKSLNPPTREKIDFIRKGVIGDWKNHFSDEQSERLSAKFFERTKGTFIEEMYKIYI